MELENYKKGDATYYRLFTKCPICRQRGKNVEPQFWFHDIDNGEIFIGDDAKYECKKCGMNESILFGDFYALIVPKVRTITFTYQKQRQRQFSPILWQQQEGWSKLQAFHGCKRFLLTWKKKEKCRIN